MINPKANPMPLSQVRFSAKIDYITVDGVQKTHVGQLDGRINWPPKYNGRRLTVHDASARDIALLAKIFKNGIVAELEIAVDLKPIGFDDEREYIGAVHQLKAEYLAKRLRPNVASGLWSGFRGAYKRQPFGYSLCPFNKRVPGASEQLLYGRRDDGVQVKAYYKHMDNKRPLPWRQHTARVEVRLGRLGLSHHGIEGLDDVLGFAVRRELSPYFQTVRGACRRMRKSQTQGLPLLKVLKAKQESDDQIYWDQYGVGAFEQGGARHCDHIRLLRDLPLNDRIGQALHRLGASLAAEKFVCPDPQGIKEKPYASMTYPIKPGGRMTY